MTWLKRQSIRIVCDFNEQAYQKMQLREDNKVLIAQGDNLEKGIYASEDGKEHRKVEWNNRAIEGRYRGVIATFNSKDLLKV